ncbi:hypothetical protein JYK22_34765, partial [Nonomuraea sp. RK-328]|nr:hypothetical protein [Nonomuraea sp. RK-328]
MAVSAAACGLLPLPPAPAAAAPPPVPPRSPAIAYVAGNCPDLFSDAILVMSTIANRVIDVIDVIDTETGGPLASIPVGDGLTTHNAGRLAWRRQDDRPGKPGKRGKPGTPGKPGKHGKLGKPGRMGPAQAVDVLGPPAPPAP